MKTVIYIVRHGQSMGNVNDIFCGQTDIPLSNLGRTQAEATAEYLSNIPIDVIYSSNLSRAYDTAVAIAKKKNLTVIKDYALREINCGKWEGMHVDEIKKLYKEDYFLWEHDIGKAHCPGGETATEVEKRITREITKIAKKHIGKSICIASHAMVIRSFCSKLYGKSIDKLNEVPWASNASVTTVIYENGAFKLDTYSFDEHLGSLVTKFTTTA